MKRLFLLISFLAAGSGIQAAQESFDVICNPYACSECGQRFHGQQRLREHVRSIHEGEGQCKECSNRYASRYQLNDHVEYVHRLKGLCPICLQLLGGKRILETHMKTHNRQSNQQNQDHMQNNCIVRKRTTQAEGLVNDEDSKRLKNVACQVVPACHLDAAVSAESEELLSREFAALALHDDIWFSLKLLASLAAAQEKLPTEYSECSAV